MHENGRQNCVLEGRKMANFYPEPARPGAIGESCGDTALTRGMAHPVKTICNLHRISHIVLTGGDHKDFREGEKDDC